MTALEPGSLPNILFPSSSDRPEGIFGSCFASVVSVEVMLATTYLYGIITTGINATLWVREIKIGTAAKEISSKIFIRL